MVLPVVLSDPAATALGEFSTSSHTLSVVFVYARTSYSFAAHTVIGRHTRSLVLVSGADSYSASGVHWSAGEHIRSDVGVIERYAHSTAQSHSVSPRHTASDRAVPATAV